MNVRGIEGGTDQLGFVICEVGFRSRHTGTRGDSPDLHKGEGRPTAAALKGAST
jgi:hypothetical protein